jgi:hypothetical protein
VSRAGAVASVNARRARLNSVAIERGHGATPLNDAARRRDVEDRRRAPPLAVSIVHRMRRADGVQRRFLDLYGVKRVPECSQHV